MSKSSTRPDEGRPAAVRPWLGIIADDVTGATDVAGNLVGTGLRVVQFFGIPDRRWLGVEADCVVVALKSRAIEPALAVEQSLAALEWLREAGVAHVYFKYCSTFDSTPRGNIGPVLDALSDALDAEHVLVTPATPRNGRAVFRSRLFVNDDLLAESPMKDHPLNPMRHSDLRELLRPQTVKLIGALQWEAVQALAGRDADVPGDAVHVVADAVSERDLELLGALALRGPLSSGAAGLATGIARAARGGVVGAPPAVDLPPGPVALLAGSCSAATREQVARFRAGHPSFFVDPLAVARGDDVVGSAVAFARATAGGPAPLVYSTTEPAQVAEAQRELGVERSAALVEQVMSAVAVAFIDAGVRRLVVAGGETAGAVVAGLQVEGIRIGAEVDPGVPWTVSLGEPAVALLLKSGNFGGQDFFAKAASWR